MTVDVSTRNLTCRIGNTTAVDDLSVDIPAGTLCGLLGRNGAGKSTLLSTIAAFRRPTSGTVTVDGQVPYENESVVGRISLIRESGDIEEDMSIEDLLWFAGRMRPAWDDDYAAHLLERFELARDAKIKHLSLGQRSALGSTMGLASRAPLTMFDESYLGMDAVSRGIFYDELLGDYLRTQRTFIVSTHLIGEIAPLLERVVVVDHGRLTLAEDTETLRGRGVMVTGPTEVVDMVAAHAGEATVIDVRSLGHTTRTTFYGELPEQLRLEATRRGAELGPVPLQDLLVHLTDLGDERSLVARSTEERS